MYASQNKIIGGYGSNLPKENRVMDYKLGGKLNFPKEKRIRLAIHHEICKGLDPSAAQTLPLDKKRAQKGVTGKIDLAAFQHPRQKVPGIALAACRCGWPSRTAKLVVMLCCLDNFIVPFQREHSG